MEEIELNVLPHKKQRRDPQEGNLNVLNQLEEMSREVIDQG